MSLVNASILNHLLKVTANKKSNSSESQYKVSAWEKSRDPFLTYRYFKNGHAFSMAGYGTADDFTFQFLILKKYDDFNLSYVIMNLFIIYILRLYLSVIFLRFLTQRKMIGPKMWFLNLFYGYEYLIKYGRQKNNKNKWIYFKLEVEEYIEKGNEA